MNTFLLDLNLSQLNIFYIFFQIFFILNFPWTIFWFLKSFTRVSWFKSSLFVVIAFFPFFGMLYLNGKFFIDPPTYSVTELVNFRLETSGNLYQVKSDKEIKPVGEASLVIHKDYKLLGKIDCGKLSFKECVDTIKNNKSQITSQIKESGFFAMKE